MMSSKSEKRRRRRSSGSSSFGIFKCFRPAISDDEAGHKSGLRGPTPTASSWAKGRATSLPPPSPALTDDSRSVKRSHRGLSAGIKAMLFDTSLIKKSRKSKYSHNSDAPSKGELSSTSARENSDSNDESGRRTVSSSGFTSSLSLESSRYSNLSSSTQSPEYSQRPSRSSSFISSRRQCSFKEQQSRSYSGTGLCVLLVSLLVVVLWGKICAIICTSTMLYITAHQSIASKPANHICDAMDSAEYKKRIILGGFLDRKRSKERNKLVTD